MLTYLNIPGSSSLPSLSNNEVTSVGERDRVAVVGWAEVHVAAGLVVLVVVLAAHQTGDVGKFEVRKISDCVGSRSGECANGSRQRNSELREGNHVD